MFASPASKMPANPTNNEPTMCGDKVPCTPINELARMSQIYNIPGANVSVNDSTTSTTFHATGTVVSMLSDQLHAYASFLEDATQNSSTGSGASQRLSKKQSFEYKPYLRSPIHRQKINGIIHKIGVAHTSKHTSKSKAKGITLHGSKYNDQFEMGHKNQIVRTYSGDDICNWIQA